jgi:hypothetical protein
MLNNFWALTGLAHSTQSEFLSLMLLLLICSLALGWMTDGVMGELGFGAIGNGFLTLLSGIVGVFAFSWVGARYMGRYLAFNELLIVIVAASIFSVTALLALAVVKKRSLP